MMRGKNRRRELVPAVEFSQLRRAIEIYAAALAAAQQITASGEEQGLAFEGGFIPFKPEDMALEECCERLDEDFPDSSLALAMRVGAVIELGDAIDRSSEAVARVAADMPLWDYPGHFKRSIFDKRLAQFTRN